MKQIIIIVMSFTTQLGFAKVDNAFESQIKSACIDWMNRDQLDVVDRDSACSCLASDYAVISASEDIGESKRNWLVRYYQAKSQEDRLQMTSEGDEANGLVDAAHDNCLN